jgi:N-acetylglucosamine malate deacetylase 1
LKQWLISDPEKENMKTSSRREFINQTMGGMALLGTASGLGTEVQSFQNEAVKPSGGRLKIVVAGGHPGDPEYGCGGTVAKYSNLGHDVALLYLNRGEAGIDGKSYSEAAAIRTAEAENACRILKARAIFARQVDGQSVVDASHYTEFDDILSAENPDIIFTQWPIDNHPDHRAVSTLVYNAWLRLKKSNSSGHPVLYYYEVSDGEDTMMFTPDTYIDITAYEKRKHEACYAHASQAPGKFYSLQEQVSGFRGIECGCKLAEAFIRHIRPGTNLL